MSALHVSIACLHRISASHVCIAYLHRISAYCMSIIRHALCRLTITVSLIVEITVKLNEWMRPKECSQLFMHDSMLSIWVGLSNAYCNRCGSELKDGIVALYTIYTDEIFTSMKMVSTGTFNLMSFITCHQVTPVVLLTLQVSFKKRQHVFQALLLEWVGGFLI